MPFLTSAATDAGILPANWFGIVTDILSDVRFAAARVGGSPCRFLKSSFPATASVSFIRTRLRHAPGLGIYLKQVWDFDGYPKSLSTALVAPILPS